MNVMLQIVPGLSHTCDSTVLQAQLLSRSSVTLLLGYKNNANTTYH